VLADREGVQRVVTYGFGDLDRQRKLQAEELFQIGSIIEVVPGTLALQMRDEGKLDLHKPVSSTCRGSASNRRSRRSRHTTC
jgi:CubicO group peptidase (beta-lactamase class C family)